MRELLSEIFESLRQNKLRTSLTGFSVAWGIFMLVVLLGAGNGLKNGLMSNFGSQMINSGSIFGGYTTVGYGGFNRYREVFMRNEDLDIIMSEFGDYVKDISALDWYNSATARYENMTITSGMRGVTPEIGPMLGEEILYGRYINSIDMKLRRKTAVVDENIVKVLFKGENPVGKTLMAGDIVENKVFSTRTFSLAGIGINETKAFISAFSRLDPEQKDLQAMLAEAKEKIVGYYTTHCDEIIRNAQALAGMQKYDEAIFRLMSVPNVCSDCYALCQQTAVSLYTGKINSESTALLNEARTIWMKQPDDVGAQKVAVLINQIAPEASNYKEVEAFRKDIADKLEADARKAWDLEMKQYQDRQEFKRSIVDACKAVGVAFGKGQPQSIVKTITSRW